MTYHAHRHFSCPAPSRQGRYGRGRRVAVIITLVLSSAHICLGARRVSVGDLLTRHEADVRLDELKRPVPMVREILLEEYNAIRSDKESLKHALEAAESGASDSSAAQSEQQILDTLQSLKQQVAECKAPNVREITQTARALWNQTDDETPLGLDAKAGEVAKAENISCDGLRRMVDGFPNRAELASKFAESRKAHDAALQDQVKATKDVLTALETRETQVTDALSRIEDKERRGENFFQKDLGILVGIVAAFSILLLIVVRFYPASVQSEWVQSGQVIQFLTVMVLLTTIMTLGILGKITEQVLGTLLGGIAGYVLAQGVGRAATHEAQQLGRMDRLSVSAPPTTRQLNVESRDGQTPPVPSPHALPT